jgi:hypothetical protein
MADAVAALAAHVGDALKAGQDFIQGFINGIGSMIGGVASAAGNAAGAAMGAVNGALGRKSPARETILAGQDFGLGFQIGIGNSIPGVASSAAQLGHQAAAALGLGHAGFGLRPAFGSAGGGAALRPIASLAPAQSQQPQTLHAQVVIDGGGLSKFVIGTAFAPLTQAAQNVGRRGVVTGA